ncbi:hypothetical protein DUNSADRAFT_5520 [Dunaliella salina]|uniref:Uncharacterized protein n=1 Tax=Dunaliella salina TaxID=3046 RepID=A0ABQ7GQ65_DUNSA|nr:hypothetical protein DUNSADRAFT_5520 [Dunaliella salina]|eukprot:KAF5836731.1 hypothetical protein DUNSADRAFT_5520 [Dunaliella salina]
MTFIIIIITIIIITVIIIIIIIIIIITIIISPEFCWGLSSSQVGRQARMEHLRSAALIQRAACVDLIGERAFLELYDLLSSHQVSESSMTELSRLVFKIISYDKSEVIQMLYKLLYMESQLECGDPNAIEGSC